ncbi:MSMEG_0570 family nitrogen starvation response protein [Saccharopolyspora sp. 5N708]|uniref:MSMEG_0570 family nitrogen starvation response protein n=1 Tax=Saccharopolyspora sp. 5N708 TaxID=3457424 RepID=UPI003FD21965
MYFRVRWPDGEIQRCYSPSTVIADYFEPGAVYSVADFVECSRQALGIASARVRAKYGVACAAAADQLVEIETTAAAFTDERRAAVTVEALLPASGSPR